MSIWAGLDTAEQERELAARTLSLEVEAPMRLAEDQVGAIEGMARAPLSAAVRLASAADSHLAIPLGSALYNLTGYEGLNPDQLWREHQETFGRTKKILTPKPEEVTTAGQISFGLVQGLTELASGGPAALIFTEQANAGADMVEQGVDSGTAQGAALITGTANAIGIALPGAIGTNLTTKLMSGAGINVVAGGAAEGAQKELLEQRGYQKLADQIDPFDLKARSVDALMGAAFGGLAHLGAPDASPAQKNAAAALNLTTQAEAAAPGRPADIPDMQAHNLAFEKAQDDLMSDRPVDVAAELQGATFLPDRRREALEVGVEQAMDDITQEEAKINPSRFLTPDELAASQYEAQLIEQSRDLGLSEDQARELARRTTPAALRDNVTSLYEARVGEGEQNLRFSAIDRAQKLVDETDAPATYVHADLANLGGLNAVLTETGANEIFRFAATAFREELAKIGADVRALTFRHGGDEISGVVLNATEEQARAALQRASDKLRNLAETMTTPKGGRVSEIEHPKHPGVAEKRGTGLSYGTSAIRPGRARPEIIQQAERQLEAMKKEVAQNVTRNTVGEPGAQPSGGQAGRAAGRAAEADSGSRSQDAGGRESLFGGQEGQGLDLEQLKVAEQAILENPLVPAIDETTGQHVPAGELLAKIDSEIQDATKRREALLAAAACFLRNGGL